MVRRFSVNFAILSILLDVLITFVSLMVANYLRPLLPSLPLLVKVPAYSIPISLMLLIPAIWALTFLFSSVYDPRRVYKVVDEIQTIILASSVATLICAGVLYLGFRNFSRWLLVTFVLINIISLLCWRFAARFLYRLRRRSFRLRRVLIIGAGQVGVRVQDMIGQYSWTGIELVGFLDDDERKLDSPLPILGRVKDAYNVALAQQVDDVVVALPRRAYGQINQLTLALHNLPVNVRIVPDYFSLALYRASVEDFGGIPMINLRDPALNDVQRMTKRVFDLLVGAISVSLVLPLLVIVAIAIKLDSPGSILFLQERLGENGRIFKMYKFRTMIVGAEQLQDDINEYDENGKVTFKRPDDPRVTRVGRFLRRTSLDEIPQLFNVLRGDMSLVGPRPELPWMVTQYETWQHKRFAVPQGMTGWWQVNGRSDKPMHLNTDDDIYYVQNYSIWMDIYILAKTPWVVLRGKGAY